MRKKNKNFVITLLLLTIFSLPLITLADINSYKLEQGIPFIGGAGATLSYGDFNKLFERFITIVYIIAAIAAFIKILIAGIKWYTSGGSSKAISQAKEDIKNGLIGLCFLLLAGILLEFINPNLNKLSDVFKPDAGVECSSISNGGSLGAGGLVTIPGTSYYANSDLVTKLVASKVNFTISTGCTSSNSAACNPNYCENNCQPCTIGGGSCTPLTSVSCHFNGTCVDITPADEDTIKKLRCAGLDVFYEPGNGSCGESTGTHLHISIPSSGFTPKNTSETCWFPHQASNSTFCQGSGGGGGGGW